MSAFRATADPGTLQRAEWIKYVAPFFNKELEANKKFADIKGSYDTITAAAKKSPATPPKSVAWVAWSSYAGPGVVVYTTPFKDQFIKVNELTTLCSLHVSCPPSPALLHHKAFKQHLLAPAQKVLSAGHVS